MRTRSGATSFAFFGGDTLRRIEVEDWVEWGLGFSERGLPLPLQITVLLHVKYWDFSGLSFETFANCPHF